MDKDNIIINLSDISFAYSGNATVLDKLNLQLYSGERLGLIGPNGSGKTTLFHIIMGLLKPSSGIIEIFGKHVSEEKDFRNVRERIGLLFQDADDQLFSPTVLEDVAFGPLNVGKSQDEAKESYFLVTPQTDIELSGSNEDAERALWGISRAEAGTTNIHPDQVEVGKPVLFTCIYTPSEKGLHPGSLIRFSIPLALVTTKTQRHEEKVIVKNKKDKNRQEQILTGSQDQQDKFKRRG